MLVPALALAVAARLAAPLLDPATAAGFLALAAAPATLALAPRAGALGGRRDTAGAFVLGTMVVWLVLMVTGAPGGAAALPGIQAFALAAAVAAGFPKVRDAVFGPLRWLGDGALLVLLGAAAISEIGGPPVGLGAATVVATGVLMLGILAAATTARLARRDPRSALIGSGTRDAGVAVAMATVTVPGATGVPLLYAGVLAIGAAAVIATSRARDRGRPIRSSG